MSIRKILPVAASILALGLAGCITVFPKTKPAQLYRFGGEPSAAARPAAASTRFTVLRGPTGFTRAAATDRILTVNRQQAAYIAEARWLAPAATLFDEALQRAFDASDGPARLVQRTDVTRADYVIRLDVRTFEARYDEAGKGAPTVVVQVRAVMARPSDRALLGDKVFEGRSRAADNRVGAIVPAYDAAVGDVLGQIVAWTDQTGAASLAPRGSAGGGQ